MSSNVERLVALGYPQAWCVRALHACANSLEEAVEYMISNADYLEEAVREAERAQQHKRVQETEAEEDGWMSSVSNELGFTSIGSSTTQVEEEEMGAAAWRQEEDEGQPATTNKWGFRITVTPCYSYKVSKQLANEPQTRERLSILTSQISGFTHAHDVTLVQLVGELCTKESLDPLVISPATVLQHQHRALAAALPNFTPTQIGLRFIVLRNFNRRMLHALPLIDLSSSANSEASGSKLARKVCALRAVIFIQVKRLVLERALRASHTGDAASLQSTKLPTVVLDRAASSSSSSPPPLLNVFGQLFSQLYRRVPLGDLRNSDRAFYCILAGEHSDDFGGPYRDALHQACEELMSSTTSNTLFCKCPSAPELFVPNPRASTQAAIEMFEFCGVLMGIAIRTKTPLPLRLPALCWKRLCGQANTLADLREMDTPMHTLLAQLERIATREEWNESRLTGVCYFAIQGVDGRVEELVLGGRRVPVTFDNRNAFCSLARRHRLQREYAAQCEAMKRGMATQVPIHLITSLFTWEEVNLLVCGREEIDLDLLRTCTVYGEGVTEEMVEYFWQALKSFSHEERKLYMRFVWGRSTLPAAAADFERQHKLNLLDVKHTYRRQRSNGGGDEDDGDDDDGGTTNKPGVDSFLPVSHTCFFSIEFPKYTTQAVFTERLLYAVRNCTSIDADETTNARRSAEQDRARVTRVNQDEEDFGWGD